MKKADFTNTRPTQPALYSSKTAHPEAVQKRLGHATIAVAFESITSKVLELDSKLDREGCPSGLW